MMQNKNKPQCQTHSSVHVGVIATESSHSCLAWKMSNHRKEVIVCLISLFSLFVSKFILVIKIGRVGNL